MDARVYELLNDQINKELYSSYLYLSFADYYEEEGLEGFANWYEIQAKEERDHALIFRNYLHENGEAVKLLAIDQPDKTFANFLEPLEAAMEHEKYVTSLINDIYAAALEAHDYRAQKFLGWFIDEQLEEEDNADKMIAEDGGAFTAHTTNPVPLVLVDASGSNLTLSGAEGRLADIAPTLLELIGLEAPAAMTGRSLLA